MADLHQQLIQEMKTLSRRVDSVITSFDYLEKRVKSLEETKDVSAQAMRLICLDMMDIERRMLDVCERRQKSLKSDLTEDDQSLEQKLKSFLDALSPRVEALEKEILGTKDKASATNQYLQLSVTEKIEGLKGVTSRLLVKVEQLERDQIRREGEESGRREVKKNIWQKAKDNQATIALIISALGLIGVAVTVLGFALKLFGQAK